jgi:hypothetical protein
MSVRRWGTISKTPYSGDIPEILASLESLVKAPGGAVIKAGSPYIQPGTFLRRITSGQDIYYFLPSGVGVVDTSLGAATVTSFYSQNVPWSVGQNITVGAAAATVAAINYDTHLVTLTAAITLPTNGMRAFGTTASDNTIDCVALDYAPYVANSDQAIEVATGGIFKKNLMDRLYSATDITAWGALAQPAHNMYRWS